MSSLLHPLTYWPPGSTAPQQLLGRVALKGASPRDSLATAGASKAYLKQDVFQIGGIVADGIHASIPPTAREVMQVDPRKSRRGKRKLYEATLSDYDGTAMFDEMTVYRSTKRDDGMGGFISEPATVGTYPCEVTYAPDEVVAADNERADGEYKLVALRDANLQTGDSVYITSRSVYLSVTGAVDKPPHGLYLMARLSVNDKQNPDDLEP